MKEVALVTVLHQIPLLTECLCARECAHVYDRWSNNEVGMKWEGNVNRYQKMTRVTI